MAIKIKIKTKQTLIALFIALSLGSPVLAQNITQESMGNPADGEKVINRGEAVHQIVSSLDLAEKEVRFVKDCWAHLEECFFAFSARSDFDGIMFSPLILYPDVFPAHPYYRDINLASMLGIVQGYLNFDKSPFKPQDNVTRIQALKMVLIGTDLMPWKEKFELAEGEMAPKLVAAADELSSEEKWWYARYLNFALDAGIISEADYALPDAQISASQMTAMIGKAKAYLNKLGATTNARTNGKKET
ncbi:MAG TPA: S-layer homology domain-containing protein [Candidatus Gracilibacteria bacterium]|nr:S-layer homology domain-containing protein [Candidatus Gracilibacteria bacterium]